jgi:hypothetical protein
MSPRKEEVVRFVLPLIASLSIAILVVPLFAAPVATGDLLELIDVERAAYLRDGVSSLVSSYDRLGGNDDGFSGQFSFIRKEGKNFVIFDAQGPGCIYRLWSANPGKGWLKFYFDGEETPKLQVEHFEDLFKDKIYPFVPPVSQYFLEGWCSYVPIPFQKSLKIVAQGPVRFLQMTWYKFPSADGVKTFDANYSQEDRIKLVRVKRAWRNLGQPPVPFPALAEQISESTTIAPQSTATLCKLEGAGLVRSLKVKATSGDPKFLRKTLLLVNVDGKKTPNVYSPLGDFFLDPFGGEKAQSLLIGKADDMYYSYWVMPYSAGASVKIENDSSSPLQLSYEVVYEPLDKLPDGMGRFFAWWHRQNPTIRSELFPILDAKGRGQWCGVSHAMQGMDEGLGFLEGDEMAWIDGRDNSYYNGTGTEDYFNGGWYFQRTGSAPLYGCGVLNGWGKCHAYRIQLTDLLPFQKTARIGIEHGVGNDVPADYAGVTYGYAGPGMTHSFKPATVFERLNRPTPARDVIEAENAFDPKSGGKVVSDDASPVCYSSGRAVITSGGQGKSFTLFMNTPEAGAYRVKMAFEKGPNRGIAEVSVDGQIVGQSVDTYAMKTIPRQVVQVGLTQDLTPGPHRLIVKSLGKNKDSAGNGVLVDFFAIKSEMVYEGELLQVIRTSDGNAEEQQLGSEFSNGALLFFRDSKTGSSITLKLPVSKPGVYPVSAWMTQAYDYGIVQLKLDGKPLGKPFDGYNNGITRKLVKLGDIELTAGDHELMMEITGKNPKSSGYFAGLDALMLK